MVTNTVLDYIYGTHGHRITQWNNTVMYPAQLQVCGNAVSAKDSPLDNCFGFIDGTDRPICHPRENQRVVYIGNKRVHALKFQSVAPWNRIIENMYGPVGKVYLLTGFPEISIFFTPSFCRIKN